MKVIENSNPIFAIKDSEKLMERQLPEIIDLKCKRCGELYRMYEFTITKYSEDLLNLHIEDLNKLVSRIIESSIEIFGRNVLQDRLVKKVEEFKKDLYKPDLKCIKNDNDKV